MSQLPMMAVKTPSRLKSESGLASIEAIPLIVVFVMLTGYAMGMWGSVHSAILQSIAARTYAFETFGNRANLNLHRDTDPNPLTNKRLGYRFHSIRSEASNEIEWHATARPLSIGFPAPEATGRESDHNTRIYEIGPRNRNVDVSPMWIMVGHGICLNARCGE